MIMKRLVLLFSLLTSFVISAQSLEGSWRLVEQNGLKIDTVEVIRIYEDNYFAESAKNKGTDEFLWAEGGEYQTGDYKEIIDFTTRNKDLVGETLDPKLSFINKDKIQINDVTNDEVWERISDSKNNLTGNWVITGRKRDGEISRSTPGDRRTIKILGGDRFQWVAFNSKTGEFFGSGAGTYDAKDGKYTENIDNFSRDKNRVGAHLQFDYIFKDNEWHHIGKSSNGDPMYEVWEPYADAYQKKSIAEDDKY